MSSPRRVSQQAAVDAVLALGSGTRFVGVDGPGGAGKSRLAARIAAAVPGAVVVSVDEFSGPDVPAWDWARLHDQVVAPLSAGRLASYESRRWDQRGAGEWRTVEPGRLVVIEGVSCTRQEAQVPWSLRLWVDTPAEVRLARLLERDGARMREQWERHWIPSERAYIAAQRPQERADLVVCGED